MHEYDQAIEDYEAVISDPPAVLNWDVYIYQAHSGLIHMYFDQDKKEDVQRVLKLALERYPNRRHLAVLEGMIHMHYDELDQALAALQRAKTFTACDAVGQKNPPASLSAPWDRCICCWANRTLPPMPEAMLALKGITLHYNLPANGHRQNLAGRENYARLSNY